LTTVRPSFSVGWFHEVTSYGLRADDGQTHPNDGIHMAFNYWMVPPATDDPAKPYEDDYWESEWAEPRSRIFGIRGGGAFVVNAGDTPSWYLPAGTGARVRLNFLVGWCSAEAPRAQQAQDAPKTQVDRERRVKDDGVASEFGSQLNPPTLTQRYVQPRGTETETGARELGYGTLIIVVDRGASPLALDAQVAIFPFFHLFFYTPLYHTYLTLMVTTPLYHTYLTLMVTTPLYHTYLTLMVTSIYASLLCCSVCITRT
ncbi:MAG: hypothetical protein BJ554DRAFT_8111, partial [Olpidium bornovanus]